MNKKLLEIIELSEFKSLTKKEENYVKENLGYYLEKNIIPTTNFGNIEGISVEEAKKRIYERNPDLQNISSELISKTLDSMENVSRIYEKYYIKPEVDYYKVIKARNNELAK